MRAVHADQAFAVHDGLLNEAGLGMVGGLLGERGPGTPDAVQPAGPGGLGRALSARPVPRDRISGRRGCARPETALGDADEQHRGDHGEDEAEDVQLEDARARR